MYSASNHPQGLALLWPLRNRYNSNLLELSKQRNMIPWLMHHPTSRARIPTSYGVGVLPGHSDAHHQFSCVVRPFLQNKDAGLPTKLSTSACLLRQ